MSDLSFEVRGGNADDDDIYEDRWTAARRARELSHESDDEISVVVVAPGKHDDPIATFVGGDRTSGTEDEDWPDEDDNE